VSLRSGRSKDATPLIKEAFWKINQPVLPPDTHRPKAGRPWGLDRLVLNRILFVARAVTALEPYHQKLGSGSNMTCLGRFRDWQVALFGKNLKETLRRVGKVLEYLQLEFCEIGDWWKLPTSNKVADANLDRVTVMSIINCCFLDGVKINNAAGTVYEWLKGRNLI